jgi:hypothetical protein
MRRYALRDDQWDRIKPNFDSLTGEFARKTRKTAGFAAAA